MNAPTPSFRQPPVSGLGNDTGTAFPELEAFHDLQIACSRDWDVLTALTILLDRAGARLCSLSARLSDSGQVTVRCRLSALSSHRADSVARDLALLDGVISAKVEHVFLRPGTGPG